MAQSQSCPCRPKAHSGPCLGRPLDTQSGMARSAFNSRHGVSLVWGNLWNLKYQVLWHVKLVTFGKWNMISEYIVLCELWSINVYDLNVIYLCFVEFCIKFGVRAFCADLARKSVHVPCLSRQAGMVACGGTARWHAGHTGLACCSSLAQRGT